MYDKRRVKHSFLLLANHHKACTVSMFEPNRNESLEDNTLNSTAARQWDRNMSFNQGVTTWFKTCWGSKIKGHEGWDCGPWMPFCRVLMEVRTPDKRMLYLSISWHDSLTRCRGASSRRRYRKQIRRGQKSGHDGCTKVCHMRRCSWRRHTFSGEESASFLSRTSSQSKFSWAQCNSEKRTSDPEPRATLLMDQILHQFTWWISPVSILQSISMLYLSQLVQDWLFLHSSSMNSTFRKISRILHITGSFWINNIMGFWMRPTKKRPWSG